MLAHEPGFCVLKYDELDWLVDPPVAEAELNAFIGPGDCAVPQTTRKLDDIQGSFGVEAYNESRRVDGVDDVSVVRVGTEVLVVLEKNIQHGLVKARSGTLTLAQTSRFDAVSVPMAGYSSVVLSKTCLICLLRG